MEALETLIVRARDNDREAYSEIIRRFQDMAVGYAYSHLRDFYLAEEAAQEAFIEAYDCLSKLAWVFRNGTEEVQDRHDYSRTA